MAQLCPTLWPHGLQHARLPCPSLSPGSCSNSCPLSWWCHPAISSSILPFSSYPSVFHSIRVFSNESALGIRWPKYRSFSFSISPSNEYSGLIYFRMDWLDLLAVQGRSPWKKSYDKPRQHIKMQRHYFADKGPYSQTYGFSSTLVWMWELYHKEGWAPKNQCSWTVVLRRLLRVP